MLVKKSGITKYAEVRLATPFFLTENTAGWTSVVFIWAVPMISALKNPTAKGIFFAIYSGFNSRKTLLQFYDRNSYDRGIKCLILNNVIRETGKNEFQIVQNGAEMRQNGANAAAIKSKLINQSINQSLEIEKNENVESESFVPLQKYSFEEALNAFENLPKEIRPVQEVRRQLFTPTVPQKCIDSTDDIPDLINRLTKDQIDVLDTRRKIVRDFFYEKGISPELIDRIALMPLTLGINIEVSDCLDIYPEWKKQVEDYKKDTGLKGYAKLYEIVRWTYEFFGVEFNSCKNPSEYTALLTLKKFVSRRYSRMKQQAQSKTGLLFE